jgi:hypothetical protein
MNSALVQSSVTDIGYFIRSRYKSKENVLKYVYSVETLPTFTFVLHWFLSSCLEILKART